MKHSYIFYRLPSVDSDGNGQLQHQRSGDSEDSKLSHRSSSGSLGSISNSNAAGAGSHNDLAGTGYNGPQTPIETVGFVNNGRANRKTQLEIVNNRESLRMEAQLNFVNNKEGLKIENHFEDEGDQFD